MRSVTRVMVLLPATLLATARPVPGQTPQEYPSFSVVAEYDEIRDPEANLAGAMERAQRPLSPRPPHPSRPTVLLRPIRPRCVSEKAVGYLSP